MKKQDITISEEIIEYITSKQKGVDSTLTAPTDDTARGLSGEDKLTIDKDFNIEGPDGSAIDPFYGIDGVDGRKVDPGYYIDPKSM